MCIDWEEGDEDFYSIYGDLNSDGRMLEAIMAPCNYRHYEFEESGLEVHKECITDREEQFAYVSESINMRILYNNQRFDAT